MRSFDAMIPENQEIHPGPEKAIQSILGGADDRLILIKRGIQNHGDVRNLFELMNQIPKKRIGSFGNSVNPGCAIEMSNGGNLAFFLRTNFEDEIHKWRWTFHLKPLVGSLFQNRRGERPEVFSMFNSFVQNVSH